MYKNEPIRIAIVGGGKGGLALLKLFQNYPHVRLVGIADLKPDAPGVQFACRCNIPTFCDPTEFLKPDCCDIVMDVTGSLEAESCLKACCNPRPEIVSGQSARFLWQLIQDRVEGDVLTRSLLNEYETLYAMSLAFTQSESLSILSQKIIKYARKLLNTPFIGVTTFAGPAKKMITYYEVGSTHLKKDCLPFIFSDEFKLRLLNQAEPLFLKNHVDYPQFGDRFDCSDDLAALLVMPLKANDEIIGVIYVGDYEQREFCPHEISLLTLMTNVAMPVIQRLNLLDNARRLAITDELTQLYNHRHFVRQIETEIARSLRCKRVCSLLMLDIDYFKHYNDTNGHEMGNEVLSSFALILKNACRCTDLVARYGGEEFVVIMPETDIKEGLKISERIRHDVENHLFPHGEKQPLGRLTVSIGIAAFPYHANSFSDLIASADQALYRAKKQGRNKVSIYD